MSGAPAGSRSRPSTHAGARRDGLYFSKSCMEDTGTSAGDSSLRCRRTFAKNPPRKYLLLLCCCFFQLSRGETEGRAPKAAGLPRGGPSPRWRSSMSDGAFGGRRRRRSERGCVAAAAARRPVFLSRHARRPALLRPEPSKNGAADTSHHQTRTRCQLTCCERRWKRVLRRRTSASSVTLRLTVYATTPLPD